MICSDKGVNLHSYLYKSIPFIEIFFFLTRRCINKLWTLLIFEFGKVQRLLCLPPLDHRLREVLLHRMVLGPPEVKERLWTECRKTKAKEITLANHKGHRRSSEPIKNLCNYIHLTQSAGNMWEWITAVVLFWLDEKVARIFLNQSYKVVDAKPISSTRKGKHSNPQRII